MIMGCASSWIFITTYLIRLLDRSPNSGYAAVSNRARVVSGVAGFRGAVTRAAAALPVAAGGCVGRTIPPAATSSSSSPLESLWSPWCSKGCCYRAVVRWARLPRDQQSRKSAAR